MNVLPYLKAKLAPAAKGGLATEATAGAAPFVREFVADLVITYVFDETDHVRFVCDRDLASHGLSPESIHELALGNLRRLAVEKLRVQPYGAIFAVFLDGTFEASALVLDELWERTLVRHIAGEIVVAVPARDVLAIGSAASVEAVRELQAVIDRVWPTGDHRLSSRLLVRRAGRWQPFT